MWFPCNLGDYVMISKWGDGNFEQYKFIGICKGCFNKIDYLFKNKVGKLVVLEDKDDIGFSHTDVTNDRYIDKSSLNPIDVNLAISPNDSKPYNELFDTKSRVTGRLISISIMDDGKFEYHFIDHGGIGNDFVVDKLLVV